MLLLASVALGFIPAAEQHDVGMSTLGKPFFTVLLLLACARMVLSG